MDSQPSTSSKTPPSSPPNMDEDEPAQCLSVYECLQALAYHLEHNGAEVAACFASHPSYVFLLQSKFPLEEHCSLPTPSADTPDPCTDHAPEASHSSNAEPDSCQEPPAKRRKHRATQHPNVKSTEGNSNEGKRRAKAAADNVPQGLGSDGILQDLKRFLSHERSRSTNGEQAPLQQPKSQSEEDVTKSLQNVQKHFGCLPDTHFAPVLERYQWMFIAQLYEDAKSKKGKHRYSVAIVFATQLCAKYVLSLKDLAEKSKRKAIQDKWKGEVHKYKFWLQLADKCGSGVFPLLPEAFRNEHARRLGRLGGKRLFASISARYPNLKDDLKDLTYLVSYFAEHKTLPEMQLLLETLDDEKIATMRQSGLRELVSFVEAPRVHSEGLNDSATLETAYQLGHYETSFEGNINTTYQAIDGVPATQSGSDQEWADMEPMYESYGELLRDEEHFTDSGWLEANLPLQ